MTSPTSVRPRVVTVGEGLAVLVAQPGPLEDSATFERTAGGAEANVATVLAQLGVDASWVSRVGDDGFGRYLVAQLARRGIDVSAVVTDPARPTAVYVKERGIGDGPLGAGESRMLYYRNGSAASAFSPVDLTATPAAGLLNHANVVHFTGITTALSDSATQLTEVLIALPRGARQVSFDLNYRPALWAARGLAGTEVAEILARHVRGSDVVLMGADEAGAVFGTEDPAELRRLFPEPTHLVVKNDAHTVTGFWRNERVDVPALRLDVVERIGAGDAFAGGFLAGLLQGRDHQERLRFGHLCAAAALTGHGDVAELPQVAELHALATVPTPEWARMDYRPGLRVPENVAL
ncbi:sugar kinase [Antrihabitans spumae]|uniref:Sugar kinase n=1 Tax=Antrihabitans spumae TaxID=3373370 RepID=A0ABW7K680_9NOCA